MRAPSARRSDLSVAVRQLGAGNLDDVETVLTELRTEVTPLPDLYRDARTRHARRLSGRSSTRRR